jgi:hypothetical protein
MTQRIARCDNSLMSTTPHLPRNIPLMFKKIVDCSVTENKLSCRNGIASGSREHAINTHTMMMCIIFCSMFNPSRCSVNPKVA